MLTDPIGIVTATEFLILFPAGTSLPAQASETFLSAASDQTSVRACLARATRDGLERICDATVPLSPQQERSTVVVTVWISAAQQLTCRVLIQEAAQVHEYGPFPLAAPKASWLKRMLGLGPKPTEPPFMLPTPPVSRIVLEASSPAISGGRLTESVGVLIVNDEAVPVLQAGEFVPCERSENFSTTQVGQDVVAINACRIGSLEVTKLPEILIRGFEPRGPDRVSLEVIFAAVEQRLELRVIDRADGRPLIVTFKLPRAEGVRSPLN